VKLKYLLIYHSRFVVVNEVLRILVFANLLYKGVPI